MVPSAKTAKGVPRQALIWVLYCLSTTWFQTTGYSATFANEQLFILHVPFGQLIFEVTALAASVGFFVFCRLTRAHMQSITAPVALLAVVASMLFGIANYQTLIDVRILLAVSTCCMSLGFVWSRLLLMTFAQNSGSLWGLAIIITSSYAASALLFQLIMLTPSTAQIIIVFLMSLAIALLCWHLATRLQTEHKGGHKAVGLDLRHSIRAIASSTTAKSQLLTILTTALAVTLMRAISMVGLWGSTQTSDPGACSLLLVALSAAIFVLVGLSVYHIYINHRRGRWLQLPFLLLVACFFILILLRQSFFESVVYLVLEHAVELFCQLVTNITLLQMMRSSSFEPMRIVALSMMLSFVFAITWLFIPTVTSLLINTAILVAVYLLIITMSSHRFMHMRESQKDTRTDVGEQGYLYGLLDNRSLNLATEADLTRRETEVLVLLAQGRSLPNIMDRLSIADGTVRAHVRSIYMKLQVHSRQELLDLLNED